MNGFAWLEYGVLKLSGSDRIAFVHGQCSNDVRGLAVGAACRALVLNAKGQIEFDIEIVRRSDDLLVLVPLGLETALFERLKRYIIFDDVQMQIVSHDWRVLHSTQKLEALTWAKNRGFGNGWDALLPAIATPKLEQPLENPELARVKAGLPEAHADHFLGWLPQECGLETAVSYKKGCYIGQEIMARLEARGQPRYQLRQVHLAAQVSTATKILSSTREVGQLGAVLPDNGAWIALATLRRDLEIGAALTAAGVPIQLARDI